MSASHNYRLFGLQVSSEVRLPELRLGELDGPPDIEVRLAGLEEVPGGPGVQRWQGGALMTVADVARYHVVGGREIRVSPAEGADERNVRLFLLGSAMGLLLHQRGLLPLHANAVEIGGRAVAFMGPSGSGKSTLAAWFHDHGHRIVADDVCVVNWSGDNTPTAMPGLPRFRLWREALRRTGRVEADYERSFAGDEDYDKYDVPAAREGFAREARPLTAIYVLDRGECFKVGRLSGAAAAEALIVNTYRGEYLAAVDGSLPHWRNCMKLASACPVFALERAWGLDLMDAENELVLQHAVAVCGSGLPG